MSLALRSSSGGPGGSRLRLSMALSLVVHAGLVALVLWTARPSGRNAVMYTIDLVAAAAGSRQVGIVNDEVPPAPKDAPLPKRAEVQPKETAPIRPPETNRRSTSRATQTPDAKSARFDTPAPKAGGGATGGQGTDVANVRTQGPDFPYPGYLRNIVNQIAMRFDPRQKQLLRAEVQFVIQKDGTVIGISVLKGSGSYGFDVEAKGAVEAAATARAFGPLPDGYSNEALTIIFEFDPRIIR